MNDMCFLVGVLNEQFFAITPLGTVFKFSVTTANGLSGIIVSNERGKIQLLKSSN